MPEIKLLALLAAYFTYPLYIFGTIINIDDWKGAVMLVVGVLALAHRQYWLYIRQDQARREKEIELKKGEKAAGIERPKKNEGNRVGINTYMQKFPYEFDTKPAV